MALLVIAATGHGVARDARHLLAGAVLLLVLIDPMLTWSLGLVLSAGATLGVLVIAPAIARSLERMLPRPVAGLLGITLGAQLAVAPVLLLSFGTIEWVSIPANMLAVPVAAVGATFAFIGSAVALVHLGAASSIFVLAGPAAAWGLLVAQIGERFTGGPTLPDAAAHRGLVVGGLVVAAFVTRSHLARRAGHHAARQAAIDVDSPASSQG
jgi:competence protein ComEC